MTNSTHDIQVAVLNDAGRALPPCLAVGTVFNERQLDQAIDAGAKFIVIPGLTTRLGAAAIERRYRVFQASPRQRTS